MSAADRTAFTRAAVVNVVGNALKIVVEGTVGLAFGSLALVADAAHSVADLLASGVVLVWGRTAFAGPDTDHPHGHERIEPLTALFVGATLVVLAGVLLWDAADTLRTGPTVRYDPVLVAGLAAGFGLMAAVWWYTVRTNRGLDSPSLRALAADCRNDLYTTLAAGVGVAGAALGHPVLDPIAGAGVSLLVLREGVAVGRENVAYLVGTAPGSDRREGIRETLLDHEAVHGLHDLRVYWVGPALEVEVHAEVDDGLTLREAHDIETELVRTLRGRGDVGDVHVHLDPAGIGEWADADGEADPTARSRPDRR